MKNYIDLQCFIEEHGINAKIIEKPSTQATLDACRALRELGYEVEPEQFIKAIVMVAEKEKKVKEPVIIMVSGTDKINMEAVKEALAVRKLRIPDPAEAQAICSYPRGGTPPVGFSNIVTAVIDNALVIPTRLLFGGGGDTEHLIAIQSEELKRFHEKCTTHKLLITTIAEG